MSENILKAITATAISSLSLVELFFFLFIKSGALVHYILSGFQH